MSKEREIVDKTRGRKMAALTSKEKRELRNGAEQKALASGIEIKWAKAAIEAAGQAVLDHIDGRASQIAADVNTASSPFGVTFSNAGKKFIGALAVKIKYQRDI